MKLLLLILLYVVYLFRKKLKKLLLYSEKQKLVITYLLVNQIKDSINESNLLEYFDNLIKFRPKNKVYSATEYNTEDIKLNQIQNLDNIYESSEQNKNLWNLLTDSQKDVIKSITEKTSCYNLLHADAYPDGYHILKQFLKQISTILPKDYMYSSPAISAKESLVLTVLAYDKLYNTSKVKVLLCVEEMSDYLTEILKPYDIIVTSNPSFESFLFITNNQNYYKKNIPSHLHLSNKNWYHLIINSKQVSSKFNSVTMDLTGITFNGETGIFCKNKEVRNSLHHIASGWSAGLYFSYNLGGSFGTINIVSSYCLFRLLGLEGIKQIKYFDFKESSNKLDSQELIKLLNIPDNYNIYLTSGGTESLIQSIKTYKSHGIKKIYTAKSAHIALYRAAKLFNMEIMELEMDNYIITKEIIENNIKENKKEDSMVFLSAPSYPYGLVDDFISISEYCNKINVPIHLDACLGGFVLPFDDTNFFINGITSVSLDTHKYGLTLKGSSIIVFQDSYKFDDNIRGNRTDSDKEIINLTIKNNKNNYFTIANNIKNISIKIKEYINNRNDITLISNQHEYTQFNIAFTLNNIKNNNSFINEMKKRNIYLGRINEPKGVHFVITPKHTFIDNFSDLFIKSLEESLELSKKFSISKYFDIESSVYGANSSKLPFICGSSVEIVRIRNEILLDS